MYGGTGLITDDDGEGCFVFAALVLAVPVALVWFLGRYGPLKDSPVSVRVIVLASVAAFLLLVLIWFKVARGPKARGVPIALLAVGVIAAGYVVVGGPVPWDFTTDRVLRCAERHEVLPIFDRAGREQIRAWVEALEADYDLVWETTGCDGDGSSLTGGPPGMAAGAWRGHKVAELEFFHGDIDPRWYRTEFDSWTMLQCRGHTLDPDDTFARDCLAAFGIGELVDAYDELAGELADTIDEPMDTPDPEDRPIRMSRELTDPPVLIGVHRSGVEVNGSFRPTCGYKCRP